MELITRRMFPEVLYMAITKEYLDSISFEIAKQKYYNANKVNAKLEEIKAEALELIAENERLRAELAEIGSTKDGIAELMISTQATAAEMLDKARAEAESIVAAAHSEAETLVMEKRFDTQAASLGLSQKQIEAIDKLNKQLDDFNVSQATQIFRIKQALMSLAIDK